MTATDDEALESLLRRAGRRQAPPNAVADVVYRQTRRAWEAQVRTRNAVRRGYAWAASLALVIVASWAAWTRYPHAALAIAPEGQDILITHTIWHPFAAPLDGALYAGDSVQSSAVGALLRRPDGSELRLARNTRLSFPSPTDVRLWQGRLFVQTSDENHTQALVVVTDLGSVEHIGTQFLVDRQDAALLVAVRDGRVALHYAPHEAVELASGQAANVGLHGELHRWDLAAFDGIWDWADALATPLDIEGQSLYAVLDRIAQRSGLGLNFASAMAETQARNLALHGAPLSLQPRDALNAVLATTTLKGTTDGRQIVVSAR